MLTDVDELAAAEADRILLGAETDRLVLGEGLNCPVSRPGLCRTNGLISAIDVPSDRNDQSRHFSQTSTAHGDTQRVDRTSSIQ